MVLFNYVALIKLSTLCWIWITKNAKNNENIDKEIKFKDIMNNVTSIRFDILLPGIPCVIQTKGGYRGLVVIAYFVNICTMILPLTSNVYKAFCSLLVYLVFGS